jgi:alpha-ketoglutarate-dependent taurine dioxygenase
MSSVTIPLHVEPLNPAVGALVEGVDLRMSLTSDVVSGIRRAVLDHGAVVFRDQDLTKEQMQAFMENFGTIAIDPISPVPEEPVAAIDAIYEAETSMNRPATSVWHIDSSLAPEPASLIALRAITVPSSGGDTCFSSMIAAYDALSEPLRAMLDRLSAVHSAFKVMPLMYAGGWEHVDQMLQHDMRSVHPVVRVHPETGRKALFVDELWTESIVELAPDESAHLLAFLFEHVKKPDFAIRWRWQPNDIVLWDNRSMQHYAIPDYDETRIMQKVGLRGDRPHGPGDSAPR